MGQAVYERNAVMQRYVMSGRKRILNDVRIKNWTLVTARKTGLTQPSDAEEEEDDDNDNDDDDCDLDDDDDDDYDILHFIVCDS